MTDPASLPIEVERAKQALNPCPAQTAPANEDELLEFLLTASAADASHARRNDPRFSDEITDLASMLRARMISVCGLEEHLQILGALYDCTKSELIKRHGLDVAKHLAIYGRTAIRKQATDFLRSRVYSRRQYQTIPKRRRYLPMHRLLYVDCPTISSHQSLQPQE